MASVTLEWVTRHPADGTRVASNSTAAECPQPSASEEQEAGKCEGADALLRLCAPAELHQPPAEPGRKSSDVSLPDSVASDGGPAMCRPLLGRATVTVQAAVAAAARVDGKTLGWPQHGCSSHEAAATGHTAGCERCCASAAACSLSRGDQGKLVLVGLNATHVALGVSAASLATGAYAVAAIEAAADGGAASPVASCFTCVAFVATGACGLYQVLASGGGARRRRCQRIVYTCLSALSGAAALIIASFAAKQLAAAAAAKTTAAGDEGGQVGGAVTDEGRVPLATCAGILLALATLELPVAVAACHRQSWRRRRHGRSGTSRYGVAANAATAAAPSSDECLAGGAAEHYARHGYEQSCRRSGAKELRRRRQQQQPPPASVTVKSRWLSLLLVMFNVAHIAAGICTLELALVGMTLAGQVDDGRTAELFSAALVSPLFLAAGCYGLYAIFARRLAARAVRLAYVGVCSVAALGSLVVVGLLAVSVLARQAADSGQQQQQQDWQLPLTVLESLLWLAAGAEVLVSAAAVTVYQVYARRTGSQS